MMYSLTWPSMPLIVVGSLVRVGLGAEVVLDVLRVVTVPLLELVAPVTTALLAVTPDPIDGDDVCAGLVLLPYWHRTLLVVLMTCSTSPAFTLRTAGYAGLSSCSPRVSNNDVWYFSERGVGYCNYF